MPRSSGEVEKLGPATLDLIRAWLDDSKARILPVLDLNRTDAVDQHDPPPWMRELVILRDRHCVFPWCGRDARACDLDHIVPVTDEGGPPGQTNPQNLAPLCRRHHRAKTAKDGATNAPGRHLRLDLPLQRHYLVTDNGTSPSPTTEADAATKPCWAQQAVMSWGRCRRWSAFEPAQSKAIGCRWNNHVSSASSSSPQWSMAA